MIADTDIDITTSRASGAGGQHINKTHSRVTIRHRPTGLTVTCQQERSQHQNRDLAMQVLAAKVTDQAEQQSTDEQNANRRSQITDGDRCHKIRTYNEINDRITDHRTGKKIHGVRRFMNGEIR